MDLAEAVVLKDRVGEVFDATVIDTDAERGRPREGKVFLADPAVLAKAESTNGLELQLGSSVRATLKQAAPAADENKVLFTVP